MLCVCFSIVNLAFEFLSSVKHYLSIYLPCFYVCLSLPLPTFVYLCLPLSSSIFLYLLLSLSNVFLCLVFASIFFCLPMSRLCLCMLLFAYVCFYLPLLVYVLLNYKS